MQGRPPGEIRILQLLARVTNHFTVFGTMCVVSIKDGNRLMS